LSKRTRILISRKGTQRKDGINVRDQDKEQRKDREMVKEGKKNANEERKKD
jgi:hypothetical protein